MEHAFFFADSRIKSGVKIDQVVSTLAEQDANMITELVVCLAA
jgi:hypothetical protein